ncbi:MAG: rod shape-determining protein RodA [Bacteroidia bacterium]|nr:rod shape-determining protein RodA [Bacteroidia bacterium]
MIAGQEYRKLDWTLVLVYLVLTVIGWVSIFSAVYDEEHATIFDLSQRYGMQFIWMVTSYVIAFAILFLINPKIYDTLSGLIYGGSLLLLVAVIFLGIEVNGSRSWFEFGPVRFQPAELSKIATTIALASLMSKYGFQLRSPSGIIRTTLIIMVPVLLIIMQKETGSALVYSAFIFMLYREGMSGWFLAVGFLAIVLFLVTLGISLFAALIVLISIMVLVRGVAGKYPLQHLFFLLLFIPAMIFSPQFGELDYIKERLVLPQEGWLALVVLPVLAFHVYKLFKSKASHMWHITMVFVASVVLIFSVEFFFENVLQPHQKARIENLLGINVDLKGAGYNVHQSKIAIGSGGFWGKGFLQGTQTKYNFVPEQSTDFIFCTIGEEWGFVGSAILISLYLILIIRIINSADKQKDVFIRIYGYSLASVIFMHFLINIGMTIGLMPVIGIPLPFVSYGGSSLWSFTVFLFVFIRLDLDRRR